MRREHLIKSLAIEDERNLLPSKEHRIRFHHQNQGHGGSRRRRRDGGRGFTGRSQFRQLLSDCPQSVLDDFRLPVRMLLLYSRDFFLGYLVALDGLSGVSCLLEGLACFECLVPVKETLAWFGGPD